MLYNYSFVKIIISRVFVALFVISLSLLVSSNTVRAGADKAVINVDAAKQVTTLKKNMFGVSMGALYREHWKQPENLNDPKLLALLNELKPGFINIQNTMLGLPFYPESTGEFSNRLYYIDTLKRLGITSDPLGKKAYNLTKSDPSYNKPLNKNYDDVLRFFERLDAPPEISIRIPTIFTTLLGPEIYDGMDLATIKVNLSPKTGADLVHYLNDPETTAFGRLRAKNGHPKPYNVKYFVLGNELWSNYFWKGMSIEQIASQHIAFYNAMKQADPSVRIGHNLVNDAFPRGYFKNGAVSKYKGLLDYNSNVLSLIKDYVDFVTFHDYSYGVKNNGAEVDYLSMDEWRYVMGYSYMKGNYGQAEMHRSTIEKHNIKAEVIMDEFSGPAGSLGGALYLADYTIYLLNNNYDTFISSWNLGLMEPQTKWGMIRVWKENNKSLIKRPNFYVQKMFTNYFGDLIVETKVTGSTFNTNQVRWEPYFDWPPEQNIPSLKAIASKRGDKLYLMVINREVDKDITADIVINNFSPRSRAKLYELNASSLNAHNEDNPNNVVITESIINNASASFTLKINKHSLTVIEFNVNK